MRDKVTLLVGSCDSYSPLWKNFFHLCRKYWKVNCDLILVGEWYGSDDDLVTCNVLPGSEPWGKRILAGLDQVKTPYTIFILEDYYWSENITEEFVQQQIDILESFKADKVMFDQTYPPGVYTLETIGSNLYRFLTSSNYLNSVQPAIWRTDFFKNVLLPECSPWQFEMDLNTRTAMMNPKVLLHDTGRKYFNFMRRGFNVETGGHEFLKKEGLTFE